MFDFNDSKDNYRQTIQDSIKFAGKDHDFFIEVKADFLKATVNKYLPNIKNPHILDVGCGHGYIHPYLQQEGYQISGVEMADEVLALAREANPNVSYLAHDGKTLPYADHQFDIAIAICVMHHVPPSEWQDFLIEMKRVLKPNGIALIFEHNPYNPITRRIVANNILDEGVVLLRNKNLEKLMQIAGFKITKSRFILFTPFASKLFRWIDKALWWFPLGAQYFTIAKN